MISSCFYKTKVCSLRGTYVPMAGVGSSSAPTTSCGACKFLRRKCADGCVFAPYFSYDQGAIHFSAVHKVFGASNVSKLLLHLPAHRRSEAAATVSFEAQARMKDPVYGCVAYIFALQQQVARLQEEVDSLTAHLSTFSINEVADQQPCPQMVDGLLQSLPLCVQKDNGNVCHVPPDMDLGTSSLNADNDDQYLEGDLHPLLREAVGRLEHSLLGTDFHEDVPFSLEELTSFSLMEDL